MKDMKTRKTCVLPLVRCCGTCKHWKTPKTPYTYMTRHCHHSGYYGGDIKNDSTSECHWESAGQREINETYITQ